MAIIRRGTIVKDTIDALKLQVGNVMPDQTSDKFVLTYDFLNTRVIDEIYKTSNSAVSGSSATIYTTPSDGDFYLCGVTANLVKDATNDRATGRWTINATLANGEAIELVALPYLVTTACDKNIFLTFDKPIKLARNTTITMGIFTYTAGLSSRTASIWGYRVRE